MLRKEYISFLLFSLWFYCLLGCKQSQNAFVSGILEVDVSRQIAEPLHYTVAMVKDEIVIDGRGNEIAWENAPFTSDFMDIEGDVIPKYQTKAKLLWDPEFLYIYAIMDEPHVWGTIEKRDQVIFHNNDFEVFIDPSGDTYNYGEIEVNALNTVWDLTLDRPYLNGGKANNHWNLDDLKTAVYVNGSLNDPSDIDSFWSVEMAIPLEPFVELKNAPKRIPVDGEVWRLNFSRVEWDHVITNGKYERSKDDNGQLLPEYNWTWSPQKVINMHEPEKWGYIHFSEDTIVDESEMKVDTDFLGKQISYAVHRAMRSDSLRSFMKMKSGYSQPMRIGYGGSEPIESTITKTQMGYEIMTQIPNSSTVYLIDQNGKILITK